MGDTLKMRNKRRDWRRDIVRGRIACEVQQSSRGRKPGPCTPMIAAVNNIHHFGILGCAVPLEASQKQDGKR